MLLAAMQSFNRIELVTRALPSLHRALSRLPVRSEIVILDAGSTDGSAEWLREFSESSDTPGVVLILGSAADPTPSFSEGTNRAVAAGLATFPETRFILLFETDNEVLGPEPVERGIELLKQHSDFGALGFTVRTGDGRAIGWAEPFPTVLELALGLRLAAAFRRARRSRVYYPVAGEPDLLEVDTAYTSPMLIRREVWTAMQGLDAAVFPFSDCDIDFCWRCRENGFRIGVLQTAAVVHDNLGQRSAWSARRVALWHQGRYRLLKRHRGASVVLAVPLLVVRHACEVLILGLLCLRGRRPWAEAKARLKLLGAALVGYDGLS